MLNYNNLNNVEFENLCQDIMSKRLGVSLRRFASGPDGGIDLANDDNTIIIQVKHYANSDVSQLIRVLNKELPKVKALNPKQYYVCCSASLSPSKVKEIYEIFADYMDSTDNIFTILEIDDFLKDKANIDVLKKHYKLWLDSTGILEELTNDEIFVDCETLLADIDESKKFFVRTSAYDEALKCLKNNRVLFITGNPGVGKTITSKMLVLYYATQGYTVRYSTNTSSLSELKKSLSKDKDKKEILLIDDCFGQAYFDMKSSQSTELLSLIDYVGISKNKLLILNSRVTILQEAKNKSLDLCKRIEREKCKIQVLDMTQISSLDKAYILYNHLAFNGIGPNYYNDIRKNKRYQKIIKHPNYCPRIIEFICNPNRIKLISPSNYYEFAIKQLNNPREMWQDEYENKLQRTDRILLQTIYSLSDVDTPFEEVKNHFEQRIANDSNIDKTVNQFDASLSRLNEGFIKIVDNDSKKSIAMVNPSVNDYLDNRLLQSIAEKDELLSSICSFSQISRILRGDELEQYICDCIINGKIETFKYKSYEQKCAIIANFIGKVELKDIKYTTYIRDFFHNPTAIWENMRLNYSVSSIIDKLIKKDLFEFYSIDNYIYEEIVLYPLFNKLDYKEIIDIVSTLYDKLPYDGQTDFVELTAPVLQESINDFLCSIYAEEYSFHCDLEKAIDAGTVFDEYGDGFDIDLACDNLHEQIKDYVLDEIESELFFLPKEYFDNNDFIDEDQFDVDGLSDIINEYFADNYYELEHEDKSKGSDNEIDLIFDRNFE